MSVKIGIRRAKRGVRLPEGVENAMRRGIRQTVGQLSFSRPCAVDVTITDDAGIRALNREHRNKDAATDVLSFPMEEFVNGRCLSRLSPGEGGSGGAVFLGDIVISAERAMSQAKEYGHGDSREFGFLCIHAMLHLFGFDHERGSDDERLMRAHEEAILEKAGLPR